MIRCRPGLVMLCLSVAFVAGCGGSRAPIAPLAMPLDSDTRRSSLGELGRTLFEGLRDGTPNNCFASASELEALIVPEVRFRLERERAESLERVSAARVFRRDWAQARFVGFCAQGAREELAQQSLGLVSGGWVLERILVVADLGEGRPRSAAWLEGGFVYTAQGWKALNIRRIEAPRVQHADLELAPCDVESGLR